MKDRIEEILKKNGIRAVEKYTTSGTVDYRVSKEMVEELSNLIQKEREEAKEEMKKECSDVSMMLETTLGYLDMAKHHNIDKHNKVTGELIEKAIHHCEVSQNMLNKLWFPQELSKGKDKE